MKPKRFLNVTFSISKNWFKIRNEGTYFGLFWFLLNPILTFFVVLVLFVQNIGSEIDAYPVYLFLGMIMYEHFRNATTEASIIIRSKGQLLKSINLPKFIIFLSGYLTTLYNHMSEYIVFTIFLVFWHGNYTSWILYIFILPFFSIFILGLSLILGTFSVYITDIKEVWLFFTRLLWFATPVVHDISNPVIDFINFINPMYYFITIAREIIIYNSIPQIRVILWALFFSIISLASGLYIFSRLRDGFAEVM